MNRRTAVPSSFLAFTATLAGALTLAHAAPAFAADDPAAAQALFSDGKRLMQAGNFKEACPKLEESQKLDPGMGTLFQLASCHQQEGRTATAWAEFLEVASQAKAAGQQARERVARSHAAALEQMVSRITIALPPSPAGATVERDGQRIGVGQIGSAIPIDPGDHTITAHAEGYETWTTTVHVPNDGKVMNVDVPSLKKKSAAVVMAPTPPVAPATAPPPSPPTTTVMRPAAAPPEPRFAPPPRAETIETGRGNGQRIAGVVVSLLGVGGLAAGAAFDIDATFKRDRASSHCSGNSCDQTGLNLRHDATQEINVGTAALIAGGAALVGGIVLYATAPSSKVTTTVTAIATPGQSGVVLRGSF